MESIYLDLESEQDAAKLAQAEMYLGDHLDKLVILDEVHRAPNLFPVLRGLIDRARRTGRRAGQCPGAERYRLAESIEAVSLPELATVLRKPG